MQNIYAIICRPGRRIAGVVSYAAAGCGRTKDAYGGRILPYASAVRGAGRLFLSLARFSEDQFTFWDTPLTENGIKDKATPCVYEQYKYQKPVDNSACNVADAMLSLYEATGEEIYLAKGKALIDNITVVQNAVNGQIPTTWDFRPTKSDRNRTYWINCSYSSISSLLRLEKLLAESR